MYSCYSPKFRRLSNIVVNCDGKFVRIENPHGRFIALFCECCYFSDVVSLPLDLLLALQLIPFTWLAFLQLSSVADYPVRRPRLLFKAKQFKMSHYCVFLDLQCIRATNNFRASGTEDTCRNHINFVLSRLCSTHYWAHSDHRPLFSCFAVILVMLGKKFYIWF